MLQQWGRGDPAARRVLLALGGCLDMVGGLPDIVAIRPTGAFLSRDS